MTKGQLAMAVAMIYPEPQKLRRKGSSPVETTELSGGGVSIRGQAFGRASHFYRPEPLIWGDVRRQRVRYPALCCSRLLTVWGGSQQGRAVKHAARPFSFYGAGDLG
jgi:hypothetical protein